MWEAISNVYRSFISLMMTFKATDVLDIMVVAFVIYNLIKNLPLWKELEKLIEDSTD